MEEEIRLGAISVQPILTEREVNFCVKQGSNYLFRLVPGYEGFEISKLDKALDAEIDHSMVEHIGDQIDRYYS